MLPHIHDRICTAIPHGVCWKLGAMLQQHTPGGTTDAKKHSDEQSRRYTLLQVTEVLHLQWGLFLWGLCSNKLWRKLGINQRATANHQEDHQGGPADHQEDHQDLGRTVRTLTRRTTFNGPNSPYGSAGRGPGSPSNGGGGNGGGSGSGGTALTSP
jgi:hypothetical protein